MCYDSVVKEGKKAKARAQGRKECAQTAVRLITTTGIARMTSGTAAGGILRAGRQAKMQAKNGTQAEALGTVGRSANANAPNSRGMASHKGGRVLSGRTIGACQCGNYKSSLKDSGQSSIHSIGEACDSDWWTQPDGSQPEEDLHLCMVTEKLIFCV